MTTGADGPFTNVAGQLLQTTVLLVVGGVLLVGYGWLVGFDALRRVLAGVTFRQLASVLLVATIPLAVWGLELHLVFTRLEQTPSVVTSVLLFVGTVSLNTITPFGQVGGNPPAALLCSRVLGTDFETGLVAVGTTNSLNRLASWCLGLVGVSYLGIRVVGRPAGVSLLAVGLVSLAMLLGGALAWRARRPLVRRASGPLARLLCVTGRLPRLSAPSRADLRRRGIRVVEAIELLAADPKRLSLVFGLGLAGQLTAATTLWVALAAVGVDPPFVALLFVIPVAQLSGVMPTPGGVGGAEILLASALVATTGIGAAAAGAAAVLYRAGAFWLPSVAGGVVTAWYATRLGFGQQSSPREQS